MSYTVDSRGERALLMPSVFCRRSLSLCNLQSVRVSQKWEGVAACFSSHAQVLIDAQAAEHDVFLVLEDDIILADHFHERLFAALTSLPPDWEFLNQGSWFNIETLFCLKYQVLRHQNRC